MQLPVCFTKFVDIPCYYDGVMGVLLTFMDKYNPKQFEIIGFSKGGTILKTAGKFTPK
ncbi:MAG: hypothetical protein IJP89_00245 [Synergistaceae bacterium]|nr:hypothetical protein [Synergistaceae bacterium]